MKKGKKYIQAQEEFDTLELYSISESLELLKKIPHKKFDETVELHLVMGVNPKKANEMIRGTVVLPNGTGRDVTVLVFAKGDKADEAKEAGADFVGMEDLAEKINGGWTNFDVAIATPNMMRFVGKLGRVLGPRKLMPNPKTGTVTLEVEKAVTEAKAGKVEYRVDKHANIHLPVGKISFDNDKLIENIGAAMAAILHDKPAASKGKYIKKMTICSTMSPGIRIDSPAYIKELKAK
ncbi:MAG: 50S ribosomal protein L1 [Candidatus Cloacimonadota bacterium]|nr:50S ribosomal protein L1 [Candidatus Cloacimonadota bacterium]